MAELDLAGRTVAHLCVDMQNVFAEDTDWRTSWVDRVLPVIVAIAERHPAETIFTRFKPPRSMEAAEGSWRDFYARWPQFLGGRADPALFDLVEPLARLVPPAAVLDKPGFSPFHQTALDRELRRRGVDTLVVTGAETDVCVLSAVLSAVDCDYRVVLPKDAVCSFSDEAHDALISVYGRRFSQQIFLTDADQALAAWPAR